MNPDEVVAVGAAIQGGVLKGEVKDVLLLDVTPLSLGVETAGGVFTAIIPQQHDDPGEEVEGLLHRGGQPADRRRPRAPGRAPDGRRTTRRSAASSSSASRPRRAACRRSRSRFDIDANGIVHVSAKDLGTGKQQQIKIIASSGLTEAEIQRMIERRPVEQGATTTREEGARRPAQHAPTA